METQWPLVGRAAQLQEVMAALRSSRSRAGGVVLAGPAGVGKTHLATECLVRAEAAGFTSLRVSATQSSAHLPLGAFATLLPDLGADTDRAEVLRQVERAIIARGAGRPVAILVDDAHLLDDSSAALVHQLAVGPETFLLATVRSGEPAPDAVMAIWKDGLVQRVEVGPLSPADIDTLLAAVLGSPLDRAAAHRFAERSEGNLLFLRELVLSSLESGVLREDKGLWRLHGALAPSTRLVELVEARLGGLADADRDLLEVVALGEPLSVALASGLADDPTLQRLERRRLLRIEEDGRRLQVRLAHPLYGEVLRAGLSPLRSRAISRTLAGAVEATGARRREDGLRVATWRLDGGGEIRAEIMLNAAYTARTHGSYGLAARLAEAAVAADASFDASLLLGQLYWLEGRPEEAERHLAGVVPWAADDGQRATLATMRMDILVFGVGQRDEALRIAAEAEESITDERARDAVTAKSAHVLFMSGRTAEAFERVEPLLSRPAGPELVLACMTAARHLTLTGRLSEAVAISERGHTAHLALTGPPLSWGPHVHLCYRCEALTAWGRLSEAEELATAAYRRAAGGEEHEAQALLAFELALTCVQRGRPLQAVRAAQEAAALYRELQWPTMTRIALPALALALALRGDATDARTALAELDALGLPPTDHRAGEMVEARAWTEMAAGNVAAARQILRDGASLARDRGEWIHESTHLHALARLGSAKEVAARLGDLATTIDGELAPARATHAGALAEGDPVALLGAAEAFEVMGADLLAAEAAADAAVAWRRTGDARKAAAAERRAQALAAGCEGARTPALAAVSARAQLSARELEIARLAAAGVSNKDIAARLYLSLHTVQNKLHIAYEKLGVEGRAQLAEALDGS